MTLTEILGNKSEFEGNSMCSFRTGYVKKTTGYPGRGI